MGLRQMQAINPEKSLVPEAERKAQALTLCAPERSLFRTSHRRRKRR
jgi:hypothetical protein